jgi:uncharacterized protein YaaQ
MKLIIAILQDNDSDPVSKALTSREFRVTTIASTGGFLRRGSSTMLIGVEDEQLETALQIIRESCTPPADSTQHSATIFVLKIDQTTHI